MPPLNGWKSGVYAIRNKVNGKIYIGSAAKSVEKRVGDHYYRLRTGTHANVFLQRAWSKYGAEAFETIVLCRCSPPRCVENEQKYIDEYNSADDRYGYNLCPKAGSRLGTKASEETRKQFSETAKEVMNRPEVKAKLSESAKKAYENPEVRKRVSDAAKKRFQDPEQRRKCSEAAKECQSRPEVQAKRATTLAGRTSEIAKKGWLNRDRKSTYRPDWSDPEYRKQQSELMKAGWARKKARIQQLKEEEEQNGNDQQQQSD